MDLKIFALDSSKDWGKKIAKNFDLPGLSVIEEIQFEDGEHTARPIESVRGYDVFVIQSLFDEPTKSIDDKLCRLLFFIGALKDTSARSITVVIPYIAYARKDRRTQPRDPLTLRYVSQLLEAMGTDRILPAYPFAVQC